GQGAARPPRRRRDVVLPDVPVLGDADEAVLADEGEEADPVRPLRGGAGERPDGRGAPGGVPAEQLALLVAEDDVAAVGRPGEGPGDQAGQRPGEGVADGAGLAVEDGEHAGDDAVAADGDLAAAGREGQGEDAAALLAVDRPA